MSFYYNKKYSFSHHSLVRIKSRLKLNNLTDIDVINYCLNLIDLSYVVFDTKNARYIKINGKELYFIINKNNNLILTLSPIKPDKLLAILEDDG